MNDNLSHFLHGGDYNPDQWLKTPDIWDEDIRLMQLANCNTVTLGIFSWSSFEPEEGRFDFEWLDTIMDKLAANGIKVILATPSAGKPQWMMHKYPEVMATQADRIRLEPGNRVNHCYTSPLFREKVKKINTKLAQRYKNHPALIMWHVSNEFSFHCHCKQCQNAFRKWLKDKYKTMDRLNEAWWSSFWSHTYSDWTQISSPSPHGECSIHGLNLDWKRFCTHQLIDYIKEEVAPLREFTPNIPVTTNFMNCTSDIIKVDNRFNHWEVAKVLDLISIDVYPDWHGKRKDMEVACEESFTYDICRSLKGGKPFFLMETTPSVTNWMPVNKQKRPGMHKLSSLLPVAFGSDSIIYFQWRKSRGGFEKFHGAVVDHCGHQNTRVFREVSEVGEMLLKMDEIVGSMVKAEVAIIFDYENAWAIDDAAGPRENMEYQETCMAHYRHFWGAGISVDVINMESDFSKYKLILAPMLYMVKPGVAGRMEEFVSKGGTLVSTYWSGIVNENDLCFLGGFPGPLRKLFGIWSEEIDSLYDSDKNSIEFLENNVFGLQGEYPVSTICDLIHAETAEVLAVYKNDFYAGRPAMTINKYGKGNTYYMAARNEQSFIKDFYDKLVEKIDLKKMLDSELPQGVTAQLRTDGINNFIFILNFSEEKKTIDIGKAVFDNLLTAEKIENVLILEPYGFAVLKNSVSQK